MTELRFESFGQYSVDRWLRDCGGFDLRSSNGRKLGVVAYVRYQTGGNQPDSLLVRRGRFRRREEIISADMVEEVDPYEGHVFLWQGAGRPDGSKATLV